MAWFLSGALAPISIVETTLAPDGTAMAAGGAPWVSALVEGSRGSAP